MRHRLLHIFEITKPRRAPTSRREKIGSQRLLEAGAETEAHVPCLSAAVTAATCAQGNSDTLVGAPEAVTKALLEYQKLGRSKPVDPWLRSATRRRSVGRKADLAGPRVGGGLECGRMPAAERSIEEEAG